MTAVSCASPSDCAAVGWISRTGSSRATLAETWQARRWLLTDPASGAEPSPGTLQGVACASRNRCTAVGSAAGLTLAKVWNGARWAVQRTPNPLGAYVASLHAVSCSSLSSCIAVGSYKKGVATLALAERWNGRRWSLQLPLNAPGADASDLSDVACTSSTACIAVGAFSAGSSRYGAIIERWDGQTWSLESIANASMVAISCPSTAACTTVGYNSAMRWDGTSWVTDSLPSLSSGKALLEAVACPSLTMCVAVGGDSEGGSLAEHWNGTSWRIEATVDPGDLNQFEDVACASPTACETVGSYHQYEDDYAPLTERWNGKRWTNQTAPDFPFGDLAGVACPSSSDCTAVGDYGVGTVTALAEHWNGRRWSIQPTPGSVFDMSLDSVACPSSHACIAVGVSGTEHYDTAVLAEERS